MKQMISKRVRIGMRAAMLLAVMMMAMFAMPQGALAQGTGSSFSITVTAEPAEGGTVTGGSSGSYADGTQLEFKETPNEGYRFKNWTINGINGGSEDTYPFIVDGNFSTVVAHFERVYTLSGSHVFFFPEGSLDPITEAGEGQKVKVCFDFDAQIGNKYFTGSFKSDDVTITVDEVGDGTFTMPAKNVTVTPVLATQEQYTIDLTTGTTQTIPPSMWILLNGLADNYLIDLNNDGKNDIQMNEVYNESTGVSTYSVIRLAGADYIDSDLSIPLNYIYNLQYNSVLFKLKKKAVQSDWITINGGPFTYTGMEIKPAVTVMDGTKDITQQFNISYNNNLNAGEATVTVTAKTTSTGYTGSASKKFTIAPKPVTVESGLTVSSTTLNEITGYSVDATNVKIVGAVNNEMLSIRGVIARLQNGSTVICDLDYTAATIVIGVEKANNYVVAQQGNQATAEITASTETVKNADGSTIETATTRVKNADGSTTETTQKKVVGADGSKTETTTTTVTDASGKLISEYIEETTTDAKGIQTTTTKTVDLNDSNLYGIGTDGKVTKVDADGGDGLYGDVLGALSRGDGNIINTVIQSPSGSTNVLVRKSDASNVSVTKQVKTDAQGQTTATSGSMTIKQTGGADGTGDTGPTQIALGFCLNSGVYMLKVDIQGHGTVSDYPFIVLGGDWVTITVIPDNGYKLAELYVKGGGGFYSSDYNAIRPTQSLSNPSQYTFQVPNDRAASSFTIHAIFAADGTGGNTSGSENPDAPTSGTYGNFTWTVSKSNASSTVYDVLTISGEGKMETGNGTPWSDYITQIKTVIINKPVTSSPASVTSNDEGVLSIGEGVTIIIGENVFAGFTGDHVYVTMPEGKILSVILDMYKSPEIIKPTDGKVDIIDYLFANPSNRTSSRPLPLVVDDNIYHLALDDEFTVVIGAGEKVSETVNIPYKCYHFCGKDGKVLFSKAEMKALNIDVKDKEYIGMTVDAMLTAELVTGTSDTYKVTENKATKLTFMGIDTGAKNGDTYFTRPQNISFEGADIDIQNINLDGVTLKKGDKICLIRDFGKTVGNITGSKSPNNGYIYHAYLQASELSDLIFEIDSRYEEQEPSTREKNDRAATTMIVNYETKKVTVGAGSGAAYGVKSKVAVGAGYLVDPEKQRNAFADSRAASAEEGDDEIEIVSGKEYELLHDGYIVLNFYTPDADITVKSIVFRRPGDANNDGYLDAVDLVEMINAKNGKASEHFNLTNADIDRDGTITQEDIDEVVDAIMEQTDEE